MISQAANRYNWKLLPFSRKISLKAVNVRAIGTMFIQEKEETRRKNLGLIMFQWN